MNAVEILVIHSVLVLMVSILIHASVDHSGLGRTVTHFLVHFVMPNHVRMEECVGNHLTGTTIHVHALQDGQEGTVIHHLILVNCLLVLTMVHAIGTATPVVMVLTALVKVVSTYICR